MKCLRLLCFTLLLPLADAFVCTCENRNSFWTKTTRHRFVSLRASEDYEKAVVNNKRRTDIQQFLTQRSFQSFMFLLTQVRDPHTSDWLERFLDSNNLLAYHGTGAFNMTRFESWDTYFDEMMDLPKERLHIKVPGRKGAGGLRLRLGGGSRNNPYLQEEEENFFEYNIDIDPKALIPRILQVREQIAKEFSKDLEFIRFANEEIMKSYERKIRVDKAPTQAFDRTALQILNNHMAMERVAPSPLRKGTYDLLMLLSLHESVHRVLREYKDDDQKAMNFSWLHDFFIQRLETTFDGIVSYGSADEFIDEILKSAPTLKRKDSGNVDLVDPLAIADDIIRTRSEVLQDWKEIAQQVPQFHIHLRKKLLSEQMKSVSVRESRGIESSSTSFGAFE